MRLTVTGDLTRRRVTVFFRLFLAIPHFIWLYLWGIGVFVLAIVNWFATLIKGAPPDGLHRFMCSYVRYATHVYAFATIAANRFPGFTGEPGYEVDVEFDPPARQNRWKVAFRLILAIPALILGAALTGTVYGGGRVYTSNGNTSTTSYGARFTGVLVAAALISWFFSLFKARAPEGVTRLEWYALHYSAQVWSYVLLVTERYPNMDPCVTGVPRRPLPHTIVLVEQDDDLTRSRLTVFFRLLLAVPHFVWLFLWSVVVVVVAIVNWLVTLVAGQSPAGIHRFFSSYLRYSTHVQSFITLVANPFPGFGGAEGSYPIDIAVAERARQGRLGVAFRFLLGFPAFIIQSALDTVLYAVAILGWFASLFTGRMPRGLRNLGAFCLRYGAQVSAYGFLLLTDRYPYAGPPAGDAGVEEAPQEPPPETTG